MIRHVRTRLEATGMEWASSHTFRRTVATWMDEAGAPPAEIAKQLGHTNVNVTATYLGRHRQPSAEADQSRVNRSNTAHLWGYLWGGWGSNPRPKDYESSALTD